MPLAGFHPAVSAWFSRCFGVPTPVQADAWPAIRAGSHTLIAAPTGSGKTLAAFLAAIDSLVREGLDRPLEDATRVLYISPLKALSNDIKKNLDAPLAGIRDSLLEQGLPDVNIRARVRTGDTSAAERSRMKREPPHILVTTPESLYILLTSESGRELLKTVRSVIVDEIHAIAGSKRGAHLMLSLERLNALCAAPPARIGLSATQKPIELVGDFLTGGAPCRIVDTGHVRERDLAIEVTGSPLEAVMPAEAWAEIYDRLQMLVCAHRTTLIFVNTRRLAERAARFLAERLGEENVTAHHGSLAKEHRLDAEQRLKQGKLRALVATASLELGIDIGDIDLVCQLGSPRGIAAFLQRVGRSGHCVGGMPKGRLFPLTRDDLVECAALLDAAGRGELDRIRIPEQPLDVLAQHIVAEVASREWEEAALYDCLRRAWPYRDLSRETFTALARMLADGFSTRRGRRGAHLHRDAVNGRLRPRKGARLIAMTNGGAIPDQFDYDVILAPEGFPVGSLNEDFAFESLPGDIFQLGNTSYRILKIEQGKVHVEDAHGQPPNIPFWFGEAPGRSDELSQSVSRLRETLALLLEDSENSAREWLRQSLHLGGSAAEQLCDYLAAARLALNALPTQACIVIERFFDENNDLHLVIHSPYGARINRAWGLALRKRFCRKFNFELQAASTEDNIVLSLGPTHSFALAEVAAYLKSASVRDLLIQALLDAPMFGTRWRWNASIALAVARTRNGKKLPAQFQRSDAEDLLAVIFPDQLACQENLAGDRDIPDHPLVRQTLNDCLHEAMDIDGLERVLRGIEDGTIQVVARDLAAPSPLAEEVINARPYAFLDDAPAEERRTLAIRQRRYLDPQSAEDLGRLDPAAIARVRAEAWPEAATPDELHDALCVLGFIAADEAPPHWRNLLVALINEQRACELAVVDGQQLWLAAERLGELQLIFPRAAIRPAIRAVETNALLDRDGALRELIRSRLEGLGPVTARQLAQPLGLPASEVAPALLALEVEGFAIQGYFSAAEADVEWCERGLLARIHRYTLNRLRAEIEPVTAADFMRFLFRWQRLEEPGEGEAALADVLNQLEGFSLPASVWESDVLPSRLDVYYPSMLDNLCGAGKITWLRLLPRRDTENTKRAAPVRMTPVALLPRAHSLHWRALHQDTHADEMTVSANAQKLRQTLQDHGASFFADLQHESGLLNSQVEQALGELVNAGLVSADRFAGLRGLIAPPRRSAGTLRRRLRLDPMEEAGRWSLLRAPAETMDRQAELEHVEHLARVLLRRYGVVFRKVLTRETGLPSWRDLLYAYRRLEARGEIRGGRFVQGFSGEQFALPEAVGTLREIRRRDKRGDMITLAAADPLNLTGIITPGQRMPAMSGHRVLYRDGVPIALSQGREIRFLERVDANEEWTVRSTLLRKHQPASFGATPVRPV